MATERTVTASTTVVLVDTSNVTTIIYLPPLSNVGRQVQIRDETGYANVNVIIISTTTGSRFIDNTNTAFITTPYSFLTVTQQADGSYAQTNSFNFPSGSGTVNADTLTTSTIIFEDLGSNSASYPFYSSNATLLFNNELIGQVTPEVLTSTVNGLGQVGYLSTLNIALNPIYVAVGVTSSQQIGIKSPVGSIQWSSNTGQIWNIANGGFATAGNDVIYYDGRFIAVGDGSDGVLAITSNHIQTSTDGKNWVGTTVLEANQARNRVIQANTIWHATGSNGSIGGGACVLWSVDGLVWNNSVSSLQFPAVANGIAYGNDVWVFAASNVSNAPLSLQYSTDGSNWISAASVSWTGTTVGDVVFDGSKFIALVSGGSNTNASNLAFSSNGSNWSSAGMTGGNLNFATNPTGALATIINQNDSILTAYPATTVGSNQLVKPTADGFNWISTPTITGTYRISRPFYDGTVWWSGFQSQPIGTPPSYLGQGINRSLDNGRTWINTGLTGGFLGGGFPNGFAILPGFSNFNVQLTSTVAGLETAFTTDLLTVTGPPPGTARQQWIATGYDTVNGQGIKVSSDGINWCNITSGGFSSISQLGAGFSAVYATNKWVVVGSAQSQPLGYAAKYSFDGLNWYPAVSGISSLVLETIGYNGEIFLASGDSLTGVSYFSSDGSNWTGFTMSTFIGGTARVLDWNGTMWVGTGTATNGKNIAYSFNGSNWFPANSGAFSTRGLGIAYNSEYWIVVGQDTNSKATIKYSGDGSNWSNIIFGGFGSVSVNGEYGGYDLTWNGKLWVAGGQTTNTAAFYSNIQYSYDGSNWFVSINSPANGIGRVQGVATNGNLFLATGIGTNNIIYSQDGSNWNLTTGVQFSASGADMLFSLYTTPDITTTNLNFYTNNQQTFLTSSHTIQTDTSNLLFDDTLFINNQTRRAGILTSNTSVPLEINGTTKTTTLDVTTIINNVQVIDSLTLQGLLIAPNIYVATGVETLSSNYTNSIRWSYDGVNYTSNVSTTIIQMYPGPFFSDFKGLWFVGGDITTTGSIASSNDALGMVNWSRDGITWFSANSGNFWTNSTTYYVPTYFGAVESNVILSAEDRIFFTADGSNWAQSSNLSAGGFDFFQAGNFETSIATIDRLNIVEVAARKGVGTPIFQSVVYSTDGGSNFQYITSNASTAQLTQNFLNQPKGIASDGSNCIFCLYGDESTIPGTFYKSTDGSNFTQIASDFTAVQGFVNFYSAGGIWFIVGYSYINGNTFPPIYYSSNQCSNWFSNVATDFVPNLPAAQQSRVLNINYDGRLWYASVSLPSGGGGVTYITSNLTNWYQQGPILFGNSMTGVVGSYNNVASLNKVITNSIGVGNNNPQYAVDITGQLRVTSTILAQAGVLSNGVYLTSDSNVKENIQHADLSICYSTIQSLDLKRFSFISPLSETKHDKTQLGFLAQDIETRFPKSVATFGTLLHFIPDQVFYAAYGVTQTLLSTVEHHSTSLATIQSVLEDLDHRVP
jgi:hypothetical protein